MWTDVVSSFFFRGQKWENRTECGLEDSLSLNTEMTTPNLHSHLGHQARVRYSFISFISFISILDEHGKADSVAASIMRSFGTKHDEITPFVGGVIE